MGPLIAVVAVSPVAVDPTASSACALFRRRILVARNVIFPVAPGALRRVRKAGARVPG